MHADHERDLQRLAGFLGDAEIMQGVPGQQQNANAVGAAHLTAVDRHVLDSRVRIARDQ